MTFYRPFVLLTKYFFVFSFGLLSYKSESVIFRVMTRVRTEEVFKQTNFKEDVLRFVQRLYGCRNCRKTLLSSQIIPSVWGDKVNLKMCCQKTHRIKNRSLTKLSSTRKVNLEIETQDHRRVLRGSSDSFVRLGRLYGSYFIVRLRWFLNEGRTEYKIKDISQTKVLTVTDIGQLPSITKRVVLPSLVSR